MDKLPSLIILVAGVVLVIYGASAPKSLRDDLPISTSGSRPYKPMWLLIGGAVGTMAGLVGLLHESMALAR